VGRLDCPSSRNLRAKAEKALTSREKGRTRGGDGSGRLTPASEEEAQRNSIAPGMREGFRSKRGGKKRDGDRNMEVPGREKLTLLGGNSRRGHAKHDKVRDGYSS